MKVAIMQPYFFPYIGYFQLMNLAERWIVFDDIQFIDKGWVNRNRILHPDLNKQWQYITLPLSKRRQFDKICDIKINNNIQWKDQIVGKLSSYKKKAAFYKATMDFLDDCLDSNETSLSVLNAATLRKTANYLGIKTPITIQTEMDWSLGEIDHPGQWSLRICEAVGASEYINPIAGSHLFDDSEFKIKGIKLSFHKATVEPYVQRRGEFVPGLSIIDLLMWNDKDTIRQMLSSGNC